MNLLDLKCSVDSAIEYAEACGEDISNIPVSIQIDGPGYNSFVATKDVELHYDNNVQAGGCVIVAQKD